MKKIAYCIPVMNRFDDIKSTLAHNLSVIRSFKNRVKIYINCFDSDNKLQDFVTRSFSEDIAQGILEFNRLSTLPYWHFSWAKNSFKDFIIEEYYSSLDGDNYLIKEEIISILDLMDSYGDFVFHGFSGRWGDGTSGRITLPTRLYKKYGYMDEINPRQVDEIGLISNVLSNEQDIKFITYKGCDVREFSGALRKWCELSRVRIDHEEIQCLDILVPENPKGAGYYRKDDITKFYQEFNSAYTYLVLSTTDDSRNYFSKRLGVSVSNVDADRARDVFANAFVHADTRLSEQLTLYSVIKNDSIFLSEWLNHYRKLGVERFIIVDDYSTEPIIDYLYGDDVFIFKPLIGKFRVCKFLWLEMLLKCYQEVGTWVLTVDSDEFLSLEAFGNSIKNLCNKLEYKDQRFATALLVDMLPQLEVDIESITADNFIEIFNRFYLRPHAPNEKYSSNHSIKWAFDAYWTYSHRLDMRWRYFQTIDSLRKFPLIQYSHNLRLNQGFHAVYFEGKSVNPRTAFYNSEFVLPIRHYKFVNYFLGNLAKRNLSAYHSRTEKNLRRIQQKEPVQLAKEMECSPFIRDFSVESFKTVLHRTIGFYRILGNNMPGLHAEEQALTNLKYILDSESDFDGVDKYFVVNKIVSESQRNAIIQLLKWYSVRYEVIDFRLNEFLSVGYNLENLPSVDWWFVEKANWEEISAEMAIRANKNRYLMNNNGARNFCLDNGICRHKWVMPWDGNCFLSDKQAEELFSKFSKSGKYKYIATPMERVLDNALVHAKAVSTNAVDEPQLSFHCSAKERFNEKLPYGNQPKVELFKRLGYKGVWDKWVNQFPWKKLEYEISPEAGLVDEQSSVFRLFSGNVVAARNSNNRANARGRAIANFIDNIEAEYLATLPLKERLEKLFASEVDLLNRVSINVPLYSVMKTNIPFDTKVTNSKGDLVIQILLKLIYTITRQKHIELVKAKIDAFVLLNSCRTKKSDNLNLVELIFTRVLSASIKSGAITDESR